MNQEIFKIKNNTELAPGVFRMELSGNTDEIPAPGRFVNIALDGKYLRRPMSVCDAEGDSLTIIYKIVGKGTKQMSLLKPGEELDILAGLGNGYDINCAGAKPLLAGGGSGVPPLYLLAKKLLGAGAENIKVVLGFNKKSEIFYEEEFKELLGGKGSVTIATADGSYGAKGFVTDALPKEYSYYFACGPMPMLKALYKAAKTEGQLSLEERMGCGFGACMGCSVMTNAGSKRICRDGPVFKSTELIWDK